MRAVLVVGIVIAFAAPAAAHTVVVPEQSEAGGWERYTLVVPTEKNSPTVRVELKLPMGMQVIGVEAKPGWQATHNPFPLGAATVRWAGGSIPPHQLMSFDFLVWNPPAPRTVEWDAKQWYEDGTSDRWGEPGNPERSGSTTVLVSASARTLAERAAHAGHQHGGYEHTGGHEEEADVPGHSEEVGGSGEEPEAVPPHAGHDAAHAAPVSVAAEGGRGDATGFASPTFTMSLALASFLLSTVALAVALTARRGRRDR